MVKDCNVAGFISINAISHYHNEQFEPCGRGIPNNTLYNQSLSVTGMCYRFLVFSGYSGSLL